MSLEAITGFFQGLSLPVLIAIPAGIAVLIGLLVWFLISRRCFRRMLEKAAEDEETARELRERYSPRALSHRSPTIERVVRQKGPEVLRTTGIDELWIERFYEYPSRRKLKRILEFIPDTGLFTAFRVALKRKSIAKMLLSWLEKSEDMFVYRRLALSGRGEEFDGRRAYAFFSDHMDRIREMTGDPEWPARYMAVKILLNDPDERSKRTVREMFHDPHTLVRLTLIEEFVPEDEAEHDEFYSTLVSYLTDDPAYENRRAAKERISAEYLDRYEIDYKKLSTEQALHMLEQLDPSSAEDINLALSFLGNKNLDLRFTAAQFLEKTGRLDGLILDVSFEDRTQLERNLGLLKKTAEVNVLGFLRAVRSSNNPASLSIAMNILCDKGDSELLDALVGRVFSMKIDEPDHRDLLELTLRCVRLRCSPGAVHQTASELLKRRYRREEAALFLENLPAACERNVVPALKTLLIDPDFEEREKLHEAFTRIEPSFYIDELFAILRSSRAEYPHSVRISALLLLGKLKLTYCMQFILEHMPVLPFSEARDFSRHLHGYAGDLFVERVLDLIEKDDGKVRAALISAIPSTGIKDFLKPIREAVDDADPEVRRASVWALLEYGDQRSIKGSLDLLRDPVERVRVEAARALASKGGSSILDDFSEILADENEVESVKLAAVDGLGRSEEVKSVDVLIEFLKDRPEELPEAAKDALALKRDTKQIKKLIVHLKDADPELRDALTDTFRRMGEAAEPPLVELLKEEISSLMPHISYILEQTGYVEHLVRRLNHRDPEVRKGAAEVLSLIGTTSAFRGVVLASRDPNDDVRVMVTKALERLASKSGKEILDELKNDPDKRIRKYTQWALERVQAKSDA